MTPRRWTWVVTAIALTARLAVALSCANRFPPAGDGTYFDALARRLAHGDGYTWLWPDGAVTYASHYPVGYPALIALAYRLLGSGPGGGMLVNALVGALGVFAAHRLALEAMSARRASIAALVVAFHPALVPYTAAIMTEGVTASLLVAAAALAARARRHRRPCLWRCAAGLVMGMATLVRPQSLLLAPVLGVLSMRGRARRRAGAAVVLTAVSLLCCAPWTLRNCVRMQRCALVSVNGGWNLLIGAETDSGAWAPVVVPEECKTVWAEAAKDSCFEQIARSTIAAAPWRWLGRVPSKLAATFDYIGAAPWYLHLSNPAAFDAQDKVVLGVIETVTTRALLLLALRAVARLDARRRTPRQVVAAAGALFTVTLHAWVGYVSLVVCLALLGRRMLARAPVVLSFAGSVVLATALTHAVFFGAGRYGLVTLPFVALVALLPKGALRASAGHGNVPSSTPPR